ncbi:axoneme-associated protein mst101(2)-like [Ptychodera flava]|uniref:axoneme-associated protein mst101(2)-like n=1 Tax=Ptychodera flava TaxID=63121 RepID=UPI003969D74B
MSLKMKFRSMKRLKIINDGGCQSGCNNTDNEGPSPKALAMRQYRKKMKENKQLYTVYSEKNKERVKKYRDGSDEKQKARQRETAKIRMRKYRARKKLEPLLLTKDENTARPFTRADRTKLEQKREYWRERKRIQRAALSSQKKRRLREKDAANKRQKRQKAHALTAVTSQESEPSSSGYNKDSTRRKAISRAKRYLPKSPNKYREVMQGLLKKALPRKNTAFDAKHKSKVQDMFRVLKSTYQSLDYQKKGSARRAFLMALAKSTKKKYGMKRRLSSQLGIRWQSLVAASSITSLERKTRSDHISSSVSKSIHDFYIRPDISVQLPGKKTVSTKTLTQSHTLNKSLKDVHSQWKNENSGDNVGFTKFCQLRPRNVKLQGQRKFNQCLCEYCVNIELKLGVINKEAGKQKLNKNPIILYCINMDY